MSVSLAVSAVTLCGPREPQSTRVGRVEPLATSNDNGTLSDDASRQLGLQEQSGTRGAPNGRSAGASRSGREPPSGRTSVDCSGGSSFVSIDGTIGGGPSPDITGVRTAEKYKTLTIVNHERVRSSPRQSIRYGLPRSGNEVQSGLAEGNR